MTKTRLYILLIFMGAGFLFYANDILATDSLLFGTGTPGNSYDAGQGYIHAGGFSAGASGDCNLVKIYSKTNGHVKFGIYDNSFNLLYSDNSGQTTTADQWNSFTVSSPVTISSGNTYYLAVDSEENGNIVYSVGGGTQKYKSCPYATCTMPDPLSGYDSGSATLSYGCYESAAATPTPTSTADADYQFITTPETFPQIFFFGIVIFLVGFWTARKV